MRAVAKREARRASVAKPFLAAVPAHWDETKLVEGDPANFATIARRSGTSWYVGSITDAARTATIPLSFLGAGSFTAKIYKDGTSDKDLVNAQQSVTSTTVLNVPLRAHGGVAVQITSP